MTVSERATIVPGSVPPRSTGSDFVAFYEHEFTQAARFAWLLVRTSAVAEDLAQEAFVSLYRGFGQIDTPEGSCMSHRQPSPSVAAQRAPARAQGGAPEPGIRPAHAADAISSTLSGPAYRQRVVIVARYWGGWSEAEIAHVLGCRPGPLSPSLHERSPNCDRR